MEARDAFSDDGGMVGPWLLSACVDTPDRSKEGVSILSDDFERLESDMDEEGARTGAAANDMRPGAGGCRGVVAGIRDEGGERRGGDVGRRALRSLAVADARESGGGRLFVCAATGDELRAREVDGDSVIDTDE